MPAKSPSTPLVLFFLSFLFNQQIFINTIRKTLNSSLFKFQNFHPNFRFSFRYLRFSIIFPYFLFILKLFHIFVSTLSENVHDKLQGIRSIVISQHKRLAFNFISLIYFLLVSFKMRLQVYELELESMHMRKTFEAKTVGERCEGFLWGEKRWKVNRNKL